VWGNGNGNEIIPLVVDARNAKSIEQNRGEKNNKGDCYKLRLRYLQDRLSSVLDENPLLQIVNELEVFLQKSHL
jgi:hypothetical protein